MTTRFKQSDDVLVQELGGKSVLLDLRSEKYFQLNGTGTRVWKLIGDGCEPDEIARRIAQESEVAVEIVGQDVARLLGELQEVGLIKAASD